MSPVQISLLRKSPRGVFCKCIPLYLECLYDLVGLSDRSPFVCIKSYSVEPLTVFPVPRISTNLFLVLNLRSPETIMFNVKSQSPSVKLILPVSRNESRYGPMPTLCPGV